MSLSWWRRGLVASGGARGRTGRPGVTIGPDHSARTGTRNSLFHINAFRQSHEIVRGPGRYWPLDAVSPAAATGGFGRGLDFGTAAGAAFDPRSHVLTIADRQFEAVHALAAQYGCDLSALLLACWQVLLWRLTGEKSTIGVTWIAIGEGERAPRKPRASREERLKLREMRQQ